MSRGSVIGVDLGGTKLLAGAIGPDLDVRHRALRPALGLNQADLIDVVFDAVREASAAVGGAVDAVGFGIPCTIDRRTGVAVQAVHLPLHDISFGAVMEERLGLPVTVDNDANCAAVAEARLGAGRGFEHVIVMTIGTGIGGGLVLDGRLYRGALGAGGEIGHMVVDHDGHPCHGNCPNRGCLETLASGTALVREASAAVASRRDSALARAVQSGRELTGQLVTELALRERDPLSIALVEHMGEGLGVGLANLVNVFNPDVIVVGGGVMAAGDLLLEPARAVMRARALPPGRDHVRVVEAALGAEAGMVGAALLAREVADSPVGT